MFTVLMVVLHDLHGRLDFFWIETGAVARALNMTDYPGFMWETKAGGHARLSVSARIYNQGEERFARAAGAEVGIANAQERVRAKLSVALERVAAMPPPGCDFDDFVSSKIDVEDAATRLAVAESFVAPGAAAPSAPQQTFPLVHRPPPPLPLSPPSFGSHSVAAAAAALRAPAGDGLGTAGGTAVDADSVGEVGAFADFFSEFLAADTGATAAADNDDAELQLSVDGHDPPQRVAWTRAEDTTIMQSVAELGQKWSLIAPRLPGRTDHAIRNRYARLQAMLLAHRRTPPPPPPAAPLADTQPAAAALGASAFPIVFPHAAAADTEAVNPTAVHAAAAGAGAAHAVANAAGAHFTAANPHADADAVLPADAVLLHRKRVWNAEEDAAISKGVAIHGQKWRKIAESLPGRTEDSVRNRWSRLCRAGGDADDDLFDGI